MTLQIRILNQGPKIYSEASHVLHLLRAIPVMIHHPELSFIQAVDFLHKQYKTLPGTNFMSWCLDLGYNELINHADNEGYYLPDYCFSEKNKHGSRYIGNSTYLLDELRILKTYLREHPDFCKKISDDVLKLFHDFADTLIEYYIKNEHMPILQFS